MKMDSAPLEDSAVDTEDIYAAQRDELLSVLKECMARNEPLRAYEKTVLSQEDIPALLQKIKHRLPFSRRERDALAEAGFAVAKLFPNLI